MSDQLPLTPPECDLTDFQYMELDVRRLRDSEFAAASDAEAFRAGLLLWCAAWHQVPAASLPDNDVELANLAGFGRVVKEWKKVRAQALWGFVKCADGRLYHPVIAEKAIAAFAAKERHAYGRFLDRLRKENKGREKDGKAQFGIPTLGQWKSGAYPHGIPPDGERIPPENAPASTGNPDENALRGNGEGTEREQNLISVPDGTGGFAAKPAPDLTKAELWWAGKSLLHAEGRGLPKAQCGSFIGRLVTDYGDDIVVDAVRAAVVAQPADPVEYLKACCMRAKGQRKDAEPAWRAEQRERTQIAAPGVAVGMPATEFFIDVDARQVSAPALTGSPT
jgi:hypothetical protein